MRPSPFPRTLPVSGIPVRRLPRLHRPPLALILRSLMLALLAVSPAGAEQADSMPRLLRVGFLKRTFYASDIRDAKAALDANGQLNPQLNTRLIVLAESRNLSDSVTCLPPSPPETFRANLTKTVLRLNGTRSGQQLFTLFQSNGIATFKAENLEGLEHLLGEHERLKTKSSKRN